KIDVVFKDDIDHREAECRTGTYNPHAGKSLQVRYEGISNLILDLLRRASGPVCEDDDLVVRQIGNRVDRSAQQGPVTPCREPEIDRDYQAAIAQAEFDQVMNHCAVTVKAVLPFPAAPSYASCACHSPPTSRFTLPR